MISVLFDCRPLIMPGSGVSSGYWFACVSYRTATGRGVRVLGGPMGTWDQCAAQAIAACARMGHND